MSKGGFLVAALLACLVRAFQTESDVSKYPVPLLDNNPPDIFVIKGGHATLHCKTACDCKKSITPKITWLENGRVIVPDQKTSVSPTGVLSVKNCSSETHSRVFRCLASVGNWSVLGVERKIRVIDPSTPSLSLEPKIHDLTVGGNAVMKCASLGATTLWSWKKNEILWFKDGTRIQFSSMGRYSSFAGGSYLVISSLVREDSGIYQCRYHLKGIKLYAVSNSVSISVGPSEIAPTAPEISYISEDIEAATGSAVSILCAANGNPTPRVTLFRENQFSSAGEIASGYGMVNFTLPAVVSENSGKYVCAVKSGDVTLRRTTQLKVLSPPIFESVPPRRKLTLKGSELSITCLASGVPEPSVTWYKDGNMVVESDKVKFSGLGKLTLRSPRPEDAGIYQCVAANKMGLSSHSTFVFLERSLRPPLNVKAKALSATALNVTWQPNPINNENAILAHVVFYQCNTSACQREKKQKVIDEVSATSRKIDQLFGGTPYLIYLSTYGQTGVKSANSKVVRAQTLESAPRMSPHPVTAVNLGNKMIRVVWTPIPLQFSNGKISQYKIEYGIAGYKMETILIPADRTQIDITSLRLGELYTVEVSAGTSAGFSSAAQTTIKIGDPDIADKKGPAMDLHSINSTAVEVKWRLLQSNYITGFVLTYVPIVTADYWHSVRIMNLPATQRTYVLANLNPRKDYRIEIRIVSGPVQSKSSIIVHTVNQRAPLPSDLDLLKISNPRDLKCTVKDNTSIYLSWNAPIHIEDIDHYMVQIVLGGRAIETYKTYHTKELRYLLENLSHGTWYYVLVNAIPKPQRIDEVSSKLKRKFKLPKYQSKMVACMTAEARPGPPQHVRCNVTENGHKAKAVWYPPDYQHGLVFKYVIRYKHLVGGSRKTYWKRGTVFMHPNTKGYPLVYDLDAEYYRRYRIEVSAVNGAGEGPAAVVESCSLRRKKPNPTDVLTLDDTQKNDRIMTDDTKLGIIVGCSIASLFIFTFVIVFIWKNPFRLKSGETHQDDSSKASRSAVYNDEFLYLQRLAELQGTTGLSLGDFSTRCSSSGRANGDNDVTVVSQPLMPKFHTAVELTGSSSGQPVCTCTCLLHGRLRGQLLHPRERRDLAIEVAKEGEDTEDTSRLRNSACSSRNSEDIDSAESADSRTQILPKSSENSAHSKDPSSAKVLQQIKKETTFQV